MRKSLLRDINIHSSDYSLWSSFKKGDKNAYAIIYQTHIQHLLNYGYRISPEKELVHDTIQDLFIYIWKNRESLNNTDNIKFYLFSALRNKLCRVLKKECHDRITESVEEDYSEIPFEDLWIATEATNSYKMQLKVLFQKLTNRQKEAINLRFYQNFSNEEVANLMGINYQSACKLIYSSLKFLKEKINISSITWFIMSQLETNINFLLE